MVDDSTPKQAGAQHEWQFCTTWLREADRNLDVDDFIAHVQTRIIDPLEKDTDEYVQLCDRLSGILLKVANALNGPPPELTSWSWHDLGEKAEALQTEVIEYRNALTWDTTCLACSRVLDSSIKDYERAEKAEAQVRALRSALERTESNFKAAVNGKPVRDMTENLAENRAALETGTPS